MEIRQLSIVAFGLVWSTVASSCATRQPAATPPLSVPRYETIAAIKDLQKELGFEEIGNFATYSDENTAHYRCYYTGKLELPDSYDELGVREGEQSGCAMDASQYDVFFYPIEAVASGKTPLTPSLAEAPEERLLVVVPHEDFHEHVKQLPTAIAEAAATLVGFLTASRFAENNYGPLSDIYRNLSRDAELFLEKAGLVNRYYARLKNLYAAAHAGSIEREQALQRKESLFADLQRECQAILPDPGSFNKCLPVSNNAGLAFDNTYTRHYPLLYELYVAHGGDMQATIYAILKAAGANSSSEETTAGFFREMIRQRRE